MRGFANYTTLVILGIASLLGGYSAQAQNCNQNNLTVEGIFFYDAQGNPFNKDVEIPLGQKVNGTIYALFGGSSDNAYSLLFTYDEVNNGSSAPNSLCLFPNAKVVKGTPQFITEFTMTWGEVVEFKNIFMRWYTNSGYTSCPAVAGSNAQCYTNPDGFKVETVYSNLPVKWHEVKARKMSDEEVLISWATLKEWQTSHFEVQRSAQGIDNFRTIGQIEALGWSDQIRTYTLKDNQLPTAGGRMYYRIKQVDLDGESGYSPVMMVEIPGRESVPDQWIAYPNPVVGEKFLLKNFGSHQEDNSLVTVRLLSSYASLTADYRAGQTEIDLSDLVRKLPKGLFILEVNTGKQVTHIKLLKN